MLMLHSVALHALLADVETGKKNQEKWYEKFLWALRKGVIPAGRIISNAGAREHKPATSTINCTVSAVIHDSMTDILTKNLEAGLTLKAGCGIGYEFSTLRPKGAYVSGAGGLYIWPTVLHGYLRQDVFHRIFCRWPSWARKWQPLMLATRTSSNSSAPNVKMVACVNSTCRC